MGLSKIHLNLLKQIVDTIDARPIRLAALGYPDLLVSVEQLEDVLGDVKITNPVYRDDSEEISKNHKIWKYKHGDKKILDTNFALSLFGIKMFVIDISEIRGGEILCDLNHPIDQKLVEQFHIVLDHGTIEHCFNIAQAMTNLLSFLGVGGYIFHSSPLTMVNHGFYNLNPTFFADFYNDNGHRLASKMFGIKGMEPDSQTPLELHPSKRIKPPIDYGIICIAQKLHASAPTWPVQNKYK